MTSVSCGDNWTFIINNKGELWATGGNSNGQLGLGHKKSVTVFTQVKQLLKISIEKVSAGHHTAALSSSGDLYFWGTGVFGEVLTPQKVSIIKTKLLSLYCPVDFHTS